MSQNRPGNEKRLAARATAAAAQAARASARGGGGSSAGTGITSTGGGSGAATGTATAPSSGGIGARAKEYGQTVAGRRLDGARVHHGQGFGRRRQAQGLADVDYAEYANQAKDYARQNLGQALLVAAAAGFVIGLLVRGGRR